MVKLLVMLATAGTWLVTQNMMYAAVVLVVGWIAASVLGRVLAWAVYLALFTAAGLYFYAYQTGQSLLGLLWKLW
ncbi:MAG: hypothetical protein ACK4RS_02810 [Thiothrix sp.]